MPQTISKKPIYYWIIPTTLLALVVIGIGLLVAFPPRWEWLGIGESKEISQVTIETIDPKGKKIVTTTKYEQAKTLWDWLDVLGVPLSLALLAWWLQQLQQARSEKQAKLEKEIAEANLREEALQDYFDRISTLLVDKNLLAMAVLLESKFGEEFQEQKELLGASVNVIQARTLSILRRLGDDKERKEDLLEFLLESEVVNKLRLNFSGANLNNISLSPIFDLSKINFANSQLSNAFFWQATLNEAVLPNTNLSKAFLEGAHLNKADLWNADLSYANLKEAKLLEASLKDSKLIFAVLESVNLSGADLTYADLSYANLCGAILTGAILNETNLNHAILLGTNFNDAKGLTQKQLDGEKPPLLCNVKLPAGINVNPNRDCDCLSGVLLRRYPNKFKSLKAARAFVHKSM